MKKTIALLGLALLINSAANGGIKPASVDWVWFDSPCGMSSGDWEKRGLIVGNGRLGASVMDSVLSQRLALNEITLWTGGENPGGNCSGYGYGPKAGRNEFGCYQPFGDFLVTFSGEDKSKDFIRALDLGSAVVGASFTRGGVEFLREVYASRPQNVIVATYTASKPGMISGEFKFAPSHTAEVAASANKSGGKLSLSGKLANGMRFAGTAAMLVKGGKVQAIGGKREVTIEYVGGGDGMQVKYPEGIPSLKVDGADSVTVVISMATSYRNSTDWLESDPVKVAESSARDAIRISPTKLRADSIAAHAAKFNRCSLKLGAGKGSLKPTPARIADYRQGKADPELEATLFQFGRYCLIGSSEGSLPATLQGLWNDKPHPPWACDYHTNINIQEAYWAAEVTNLSECHLPLFDWLDDIAPVSRRITANAFKKSDGSPVRGWTTRVSQNPFGAGGWVMWNVPCNAWYALHYWEHYRFTLDRKFLAERAYPMMKEACHFWEDMLKPLGKDGEGFASKDGKVDRSQLKGLPAGTLVAPNGWSHEWGPVEDGVTHDQQLVRELFNDTLEAASILKVDAEWAKSLAKKRDLLAPNRIAPGGYLQEWLVDRPDSVSGHRHTSHLFAVYPGSGISCAQTPKLAAAAKKSLELRGTSGDSRRSWSWPWRCALWARLREGNKSHEMIEGLIKHNLLDNLFTTHPPFQMDGNYAYPAAVAEMLLQSHAGTIELLPAPCAAWPSGKVQGFKARGNIEVDFEWQNGKVTNYALYSDRPSTVKVKVNGKTENVKVRQR